MFWNKRKDKVESIKKEVDKDDYWTERRKLNLEIWNVLKQFTVTGELELDVNGVSIKFKKCILGYDKYGYERYMYRMAMNGHYVLSFNDYDFNHEYNFIWESWVDDYDKIDTYSHFILEHMPDILHKSKEKQEIEHKNSILTKIQEIGL